MQIDSMDVYGETICQPALAVNGRELKFGPQYRRSFPLKNLKINIPCKDPISWIQKTETFTGWFTFDSQREDTVIDVCKNYGPLYKLTMLEKVDGKGHEDCKIPNDKEFYPALHRLYNEKKNWGSDFKFRGLATFHPYLMEWTDWILVEYKELLEQANIFGAVAVSCYSYERCKDVWRAFCELWSPLTNTFHHGVGELGISLYDLKVIGGLPVLGIPYEEFLPPNQELLDEDQYPSTITELLRIHATLCDHLLGTQM